MIALDADQDSSGNVRISTVGTMVECHGPPVMSVDTVRQSAAVRVGFRICAASCSIWCILPEYVKKLGSFAVDTPESPATHAGQWRRYFGLNISQVIDPLLFVGGQFDPQQWTQIHALGVRAVLSSAGRAGGCLQCTPQPDQIAAFARTRFSGSRR
jgi:hypothetical protein